MPQTFFDYVGLAMLCFRPMPEKYFLEFRQRVLSDYAQERVMAGDWGGDEAVSRSDQALRALLPQGLDTPGHGLMMVVEAIKSEGVNGKQDEMTVGSIWWQWRERAGRPTVHLLDLHIGVDHRRRGYGRSALQLLETTLAPEGVEVLTLNVFGRNHEAIQLYRHLGYEVVTLEMAKCLRASGSPTGQ